jgi:Xaa-Pro aminopeptidase
MTSRIAIFQEKLREHQIDGYLISRNPNIKYYTQSIGGNYLYVSIEHEPMLLVSQLDASIAQDLARDCSIEVFTSMTMNRKLIDIIRRSKSLKVGFDDLNHDLLSNLRKKLPEVNFSQNLNPIWEMRKVKDSSERRLMIEAGRLASNAMDAVGSKLEVGVTEYELAAEASYEMMREGAESHAFDFSVGSGPRSAYPHASITRRKIKKGDLLVIDLGASYLGYKSDITRTFIAGNPTSKQAELYSTIFKAHELAFKEMRGGVKCRSVDMRARDLIGKNGYGKEFIHGLGHGIGLEIHEPPSIGPHSHDDLLDGNVVSNEPGVYVHGYGGVRIEDTVLIDGELPKRLTNYSQNIDEVCF